MLNRWLIKAAPTAKDKQRRLLYVKGAWTDVHSLVRKLGPVCGRPKKESSDPEFNYSIVLHKLDAEGLKSVEAVIHSLTGRAAGARTPVPASALAPLPAPAAEPTPTPAPLPAPAVEPTPTPVPIKLTELPRLPTPPATSAPAAPPAAPGPTAAPDPANPFAGFGGQAALFKRATAQEPLSPAFEAPPPAPAPAASARITGTTSLPPPAAVPAPALGAVPASAGGPLFGALRGLDTDRTLDNLVVGSYNRFAHAAAMSLLTNPGTLYNPLVVWGGQGTGKTHLVNALGLKLQEQFPHETVWLCSGSMLARAAGLAQAAGRQKELLDFAAKSRALIIDDVHMTGVADHNSDTLQKLVGAFLGAGKQVVVASLYASKHMGPLEASLGLRSDKAHVVELKTPNDAAQQSIGEAALSRLGLAPSAEEKDLFARGVVKDFSLLDDHLRRITALGTLGPAGAPFGQILRDILAPDAEPEPLPADKLKALLPSAPPAGKTALALFHPPDSEPHADMVLAMAYAAAKARGWPFPWKVVAKRPYPLDPPHAAPYLLAEECLRSGAAAALIVGPPPGTELAGQERLFRALSARLLAEAGVPAAAVPFARVREKKQGLFAYLDLALLAGGRG